MSRLTELRHQQALLKLRAEREARSSERLAENLTAEDAFYLIRRRIEYLNDKIDRVRAVGGRYDLYLREREAMFWMLDKIKELAEKLITAEHAIQRQNTRLAELASYFEAHCHD